MTPYREPDAARVAEQQAIEDLLDEHAHELGVLRRELDTLQERVEMTTRLGDSEPRKPWLPWWWGWAALVAQAPLVIGLLVDLAPTGHRGLCIGVGVLSVAVALAASERLVVGGKPGP